tara:strand:- start:7034 stop:8251 length:1218 start_codon:yes stop_codon:yes gene_type:complete
MNIEQLEERLTKAFGQVGLEGPVAPSGAAIRIHGVDLSPPLRRDQAACLLDALAWFRIVSLPGQDLNERSLPHLERFANHFGAPVPHPSNFIRAGKPGQQDGATDGEIEIRPVEQRMAARVNAAFPGELMCLKHESPAVLVVSNVQTNPETPGRFSEKPPTVISGGTWHTDIEYEPIPLQVSMFLVHQMPVVKGNDAHWISLPDDDVAKTRYYEGSSEELMRKRIAMPVDGETAFVDTVAAWEALPDSEQKRLKKMQVRRRLNTGDRGWLAPIVRTHPRSGLTGLHSPIWASRPRVRPPVVVEGMTEAASQSVLDEVEAHVLSPEFRYDHFHTPGDVTIWDNTLTLHNSPPMKTRIRSVDDARLLYRISCKGPDREKLPRDDDPDWLTEHVSAVYSTPDEILSAR